MVVLLPSRSAGGDLVVAHRGESVQYKGLASSLTFVAFYADTRHEVLPIETGHRVVLTYNLLLSGDTTPDVGDTSVAPAAAELLNHHFAHTPEPRWRNDRQALEPPDRLVVLLDHQYTERGLRSSHVKGHDAARVEVLRQAADLADCKVALAQAEIQETRECYENDPPHWHRRGWSDRAEEEPDDGDEGALAVGELLDSTLDIVPAVGEALCFDRAVNYAELAEVSPTSDLVPYDSEYTGYMGNWGNWGNTMDRWYRRAALVIWPTARSFAIQAKGDPHGALDDLLARTATDESTKRSLRRRLSPPAILARRRSKRRPASASARGIEARLRVRRRAARHAPCRALHPRSHLPDRRNRAGSPRRRHGLEWFDRQLSAWLAHRRSPLTRPIPAPARTTWVADLPGFCTNLRDAHEAPRELGTEVARRLLVRIGEWLISAVGQATLITAPSQRETALAALASPTLAVLRATGITGDPLLRDRIIATLCDPAQRITPLLVDVVGTSATLPADERKTIGADTIAQHCHQALEAELAQPQRTPDDWSITELEPGTCCDDCTTLADFLTDPTTQQTTWPLAKPWRQHIHRRIDDAELPVTHHTTRQGSPHKLVLTKTTDLHLRDAERRRGNTAALDIIQRFLATV